MPTSMLDALAAESKTVTELGIAASRLAIEAVHRSRQLQLQIEHMAAAERVDEIQESPGIHPATEDDRQGNQGSDEAAPGEASGRVAQSEQVVADVATGEQGACAVCKDPVAAPDASMEDGAPPDDPEAGPLPDTQPSLSNRVLDLYGTTDLDPREIAKRVGSTAAAVNEFIRQGRKNQNRLAAQGDLQRDIGVEVALAARSGRNRPKPAELPVPAERPARAIPAALIEPARKPTLTFASDEEPKEGKFLALSSKDCTASFRGQGIQLVRHEWRLLLQMNDQQPKSPDQMLSFAGVLTQRRLSAEISKLNARIALIGVEIHFDDVSYTLRPLQVA